MKNLLACYRIDLSEPTIWKIWKKHGILPKCCWFPWEHEKIDFCDINWVPDCLSSRYVNFQYTLFSKL